MQELVCGAREPITPFIVKLPALAAQRGVSCVLVIGGSGQYFDVAGEAGGRLRGRAPAGRLADRAESCTARI